MLLYQAFKYTLKNDAREKINSGALSSKYVLFAFSREEMERSIPGMTMLSEKEFLYNGKMFDVVKVFNKNDSTYFYCLPDKDEDRLNLAYNSSIDKNTDGPQKKSAAEKLTKNIISEALPPCLSAYLFPKIENNNILFEKMFKRRGFKNIPTPPPDFPVS